MFKQLMIGLFAIGAVAMWQTEANALCTVLSNGSLFCTNAAKGSGMPTVLATQQPNGSTPLPAGSFNNQACPGYQTCAPADGESNSPECISGGSEGGGDELTFTTLASVSNPEIDLTLAGAVKTPGKVCGLGEGQDRDCDINGVAVCGTSVKKNVTIQGPLFASSFGFAQTDFSTNSANLRFQVSETTQEDLCPGDTFIAFFAREAFFESCLDDGGITLTNSQCVRELCKTDDGGIIKDEIRVYHCKPV